MKEYILLILIVSIFSCTENAEMPNEDGSVDLESKWMMVEDCFSTGASVGCDEPRQETIIEFKNDGTFDLSVGSTECSGTYAIGESEPLVLLLMSDNDSCRLGTGQARIELDGKELKLFWVGCIETCFSKFKQDS